MRFFGVRKDSVKAPKARDARAWANGPGDSGARPHAALKARNRCW